MKELVAGYRSNRGNRWRRLLLAALLVAVSLVVPVAASSPAQAAGNPCGPPVLSVIACENSKLGSPQSAWQVPNQDSTIQGFTTTISANLGDTVTFKVKTSANSYHLDIYRLGYYAGNGARLVAGGVRPSASLPQSHPACLTQSSTGLIDCGNWAVSASWVVPSTAVSGIYLADVVRDDTGGASQVVFVVRNDASHSDMVVQTSDTTWQAYNTWGGNSLYTGTAPAGRAYAVSYNRPFITSSPNFVWDSEYPMVRFLEANGYDVSYISGLDTDVRGSLLTNHKVFLSSGHDEYWSGGQRASVQAARDAGVDLAFFSGNEMFWKTRWAASIDGSATANRTLVTYKETHANAVIDPQDPPTWTGTWRDPRFSPPADGGRPENALTGQFFIVNAGTTDIQVPYAYSRLRLWRNTSVATLAAGQTATLAAGTGTLGYEWDEDADNGFRPAGLIDLSSTTTSVPEAFYDYGSSVAAGTRTHHLTMYRAASGALVFGSGTVQWSWGLDAGNPTGRQPDPAMQQATVNLFADMGVQPFALLPGLQTATASTDTVAPTSTITAPVNGSTVADGAALTISGTAGDTGGGVVAGVEVSTDGGATWHPASGTTSWTYTAVVHGTPTIAIKSRATDDSGNTETPSAGIALNSSCPCSLWGANITPGTPDSGDAGAIEVGMKFTSSVYGTVSGVRFYKAGTDTGTHVGSLWDASGQRLASVTFSGETGSGWQQALFSAPVAILPNTTYVVSYYAPRGHYSSTESYFYSAPSPPPDGGGILDAGPLHAVRNTAATGNGLYSYASASTFPSNTYKAENYWVDVLFTPSSAPGQVTNVNATAGYASATVSWNAPAAGQPTSYTVTPYIGSTAQTPTVVTGNPPATGTTVVGLTNGVSYTFTVTAANPVGSGPTSVPSNAVTPLSSLPIVGNGGFEAGLAPWATGGISAPSVTTAKAHSGAASALLGLPGGTEPLGDSSISQSVTIPAGTSTLSFWYWPGSADEACSGTTCKYDWQEAQIRSTAGATLASVLRLNSNAQSWNQVSFNTSTYAGQTVVLWFNVHLDGANPPDDTWMYVDDVAVTGSQPTAPAPPSSVTAAAGNGTATVSWVAPSNGGSAITGYTVTPYIGSTAQPATTITGNPPATSAVVGGLTNGLSYTFTVSATNAVGTGAPSAPSNAVTPTAPTVPGAPTGVSAVAGNGSATVSWVAPGNGGSAITAYTVTPYLGASPQAATIISGSPPATSTVVTGLANGTSYTFTVSATNGIGIGPESALSNAVTPTAPTAPAAPTAVTAVAGNGSATVSWTAPGSGGSAITGYTVTPYIGAAAQPATTVTGNPPVTSATVPGLTNGTSYTFTVSATNAIGNGPVSASSNAVTPTQPIAPTFVQQVAAHSGVAARLSATPATALTAGNRLVVVVGVCNSGGPTAQTVTDSAGNTYTKLTSMKASEGTELSVWTAPITRGGGTRPVVTATPSSSADLGIAVLEYSGLSTVSDATVLDKVKTATGITGTSATTVQSGATAATTAANELALGVYLDSGFGDTLTNGSGFITRTNVSQTSDIEFLVEDQLAGLGATPNAAVGTGARTTWLMATLVLKHP